MSSQLKIDPPSSVRWTTGVLASLAWAIVIVSYAQVLSPWIPADVIHPYLFRHQVELLLASFGLGLVSYILPKLWSAHLRRVGWCQVKAKALHKELLGLGAWGFFLFEAKRVVRGVVARMARPTPYAGLPLILVTMAVIVVLIIGANRRPLLDVPDAYLALWQMQLAWGGAALPILLFIIEFSDRRPGTLQSLPDVLTRHSLVLPILGVTLGLVVALGVGSYWFPSRWSYPVAFVAFTLSALLTALAFFRLALLLYDRQALRNRSQALLLERFRDNLTSRLRFRLRTLVLQRWIRTQRLVAIERTSLILGERGTRSIKAPEQASQVLDVNFVLLERLAEQLYATRAKPSTATEGETSPQTDHPEKPLIHLGKVPGEAVWGAEELAHVSDDLPEAQLAKIRNSLWRAYRFEQRRGGT